MKAFIIMLWVCLVSCLLAAPASYRWWFFIFWILLFKLFSIFFYIFYYLWIWHQTSQSHSSLHPFVSAFCPWNIPSNKNKETNIHTHTKISLWKQWCVMECHIIHSFVQTSLFLNVYFNESLVLFKVSIFCCSVNTKSSPGLLFGILTLPCVTEIRLQQWICKTVLCLYSSSLKMG